MFFVDVVIVALIGWAAYNGFYRGLILVAADLTGFLLASVAAAAFYKPLSSFLSDHFRVLPSFAGVVAFGIILLIVETAYLFGMRFVLHRLHPKYSLTFWNQWGGSVLNGLKAMVLTALALIIFTGLPVAASTKDAVEKAYIPRTLLKYTGGLQRVVSGAVGDSINQTLNFLTIKPESEESVNLGFKTTRVRVDEAAEVRMLQLVNNERTSRGLKPLTLNEKARTVARAHSIDMFARGYFSHVDPDGHDPFQRMEAGGITFQAAGENLALAPTLDMAHTGLMNSPGHRANILSKDFGTVGIGVIDGGPYGLMITQDFTD
ncbi:MAG TPA: CvpA family protein [Candidatus Nanoarchaeia archaeon]|nr:CvpA family protein [Candidatus Nanoarchaeia archaeon]